MFPPRHPHPCPWCTLCLFTQVQKWLCSYELCDSVLPSPNVLFHRLEYSLLPCHRRQVLLPFPVYLPPQEPPHQSLRQFVLEPPQYPDHVGVTTHVSAPKSSTNWTTALKKNPDTRGAAPSLLRIFVNFCHTARAFVRFLNTVSQSSSLSEITRPKYFKEVTISRGGPYALKALDVTAFSSCTYRCCRFRSAPLLHCAVCQCIPFKDRHGTKMLHRGHRGWGMLPSSSITMVSWTCRCHNDYDFTEDVRNFHMSDFRINIW